MTRCICGKELGKSHNDVSVVRRPCRCGLPDRVVEFGAPHVWMPYVNPERERLGLPTETPAEKAMKADTKWV